MFIAEGNTLPIPRYFWKMVDTHTSQKYYFVGINSPNIDSNEFNYLIDVCVDECDDDKYDWLNYDDLRDQNKRRNPVRGILLCCKNLNFVSTFDTLVVTENNQSFLQKLYSSIYAIFAVLLGYFPEI
jgi:hypothetical protein